MMRYTLVSKKPRIFSTFTGLSIKEFDGLYQTIEEKYGEFEKKRLDRKDRKNRIGQGRNFKLNLRDRLLMFMIYLEPLARGLQIFDL
jgi:hypothetical protein